jgi:hypothetical protein
MLDIKSTNKGVLISGSTESLRNAITYPVTELFIFQSDGFAGYYHFDGIVWSQPGNACIASGVSGQVYDVEGNVYR